MIYYLNIKNIKPEHVKYIKNKYPKRYKYAMEYLNEEDQLRSLGVFLILDTLKLIVCDNDYRILPSGKPYLIDSKISVSHNRDYIIICVAPTDCGIDIEKESVIRKPIFNKFSINEQNFIKENIDFTKIWCTKESLCKLLNIPCLKAVKKYDVVKLIADGSDIIENIEINNKILNIKRYVISITYIGEIDTTLKEVIPEIEDLI